MINAVDILVLGEIKQINDLAAQYNIWNNKNLKGNEQATYDLIIIEKSNFCLLKNIDSLRKDTPILIANNNIKKGFGGYAISKELYNCIIDMLKPGKIILELGSGPGSKELSKKFTLFSVEHNKKWLYKYNTNYIYAPIVNGW